MNIDQASVFLAGSVLTMLGFVIVVAGVVVINNILHKYWKPVRLFTADSFQAFNGPVARYATDEELSRIAPTMEKDKK